MLVCLRVVISFPGSLLIDPDVLIRYILPSLSWQRKLEECNEQLELKRGDIAKLQERERALLATFQASLGEENKFEEFLTKVFKKKIKRVKKKEQTGREGERKWHKCTM